MNNITVVGSISSELNNDHKIYGKSFYRFYVDIMRDSGVIDRLPVITDKNISINVGETVLVKGQCRTHRDRGKLLIYIYALSIEFLNYSDNYNDVFLVGVINKPPTYRLTPLGKEISDINLKVIRANKADYLPCVVWGNNARIISKMSVGDPIRVAGRLQSRKYDKDGEIKTAYEISVKLVELI